MRRAQSPLRRVGPRLILVQGPYIGSPWEIPTVPLGQAQGAVRAGIELDDEDHRGGHTDAPAAPGES